jgi:hypothetical protein
MLFCELRWGKVLLCSEVLSPSLTTVGSVYSQKPDGMDHQFKDYHKSRAPVSVGKVLRPRIPSVHLTHQHFHQDLTSLQSPNSRYAAFHMLCSQIVIIRRCLL